VTVINTAKKPNEQYEMTTKNISHLVIECRNTPLKYQTLFTHNSYPLSSAVICQCKWTEM